MKLKYKYFAIDFDGTIAYDAYPGIGNLIPYAKETMELIKKLGGEITIWTCRTGEAALATEKFLISNNIPYDYFNKPFPHNVNEYGGDYSRKIFASVYIDDRAFPFCGKPIDWIEVQHTIFSYDYNDWKIGDILECLDYESIYFKKGDKIKIDEIDHDKDWIVCGNFHTAASHLVEYFKKVE